MDGLTVKRIAGTKPRLEVRLRTDDGTIITLVVSRKGVHLYSPGTDMTHDQFRQYVTNALREVERYLEPQ